ncbi:hypothetical protein AC579_6556 [Pseudocercospora musae]|uniref:Uncharacterized protein n=1 Tax=Pseudocercospora musae TaxID=113226 RepID=A0A139I514_9PEZI|nr:hypothetical protein AC579_6556 [Pseudocercospora musae]
MNSTVRPFDDHPFSREPQHPGIPVHFQDMEYEAAAPFDFDYSSTCESPLPRALKGFSGGEARSDYSLWRKTC